MIGEVVEAELYRKRYVTKWRYCLDYAEKGRHPYISKLAHFKLYTEVPSPDPWNRLFIPQI